MTGGTLCSYTNGTEGIIYVDTSAHSEKYTVVEVTVDNKRGGIATFKQTLEASSSAKPLSIR